MTMRKLMWTIVGFAVIAATPLDSAPAVISELLADGLDANEDFPDHVVSELSRSSATKAAAK